MTRVVRSALLASVACLMGVNVQGQILGAGQGQAVSSDHVRIGGTGGLSFGGKTSGAAGAEVNYRLNDTYEVFLEGGRIFDAATGDANARAVIVGNYIGGTGTVRQAVNYFAGGVNYHFPELLSGFAKGWMPYVGAGAGMGRVINKAKFIVGGADVTDRLLGDYGIELGNDLADSTNKAILLFAAGSRKGLTTRITIDVSYRYGQVLARSGAIVGDVSMHTNRLQAGIGYSF